jgi:hypothetical protein
MNLPQSRRARIDLGQVRRLRAAPGRDGADSTTAGWISLMQVNIRPAFSR